MFTGIIQDIGEVTALDKASGDWVATVTTRLPLEQTVLGASIACGGVCLTVIAKTANSFTVQVSQETLSKTTIVHWHVGSRINLETALRMGDELGGHLLSGHIDGLLRVMAKEVVGDSLVYKFEIPHAFTKFIAAKGSVSIDGVSLTINEVEGARFTVNLIPHTQKMTSLGALVVGDEANFEIDMIARYVERMLNGRSAS
jgi:riboflavin synthase